MATILVPLPRIDFDPTEAGVPWRVLTEAGHAFVFATPDAAPAQADPRMLHGTGLGLLAPVLRAQGNAVADHDRMAQSAAYRAPIAWADIADGLASDRFDALLLPGGHAPGMREYLESVPLQSAVAAFFERDRPVAAICHGTVLAARNGGFHFKFVDQAWRDTRDGVDFFVRLSDEASRQAGKPLSFVA